MHDRARLYLVRHAEPDFGPGGRVCLGRKLDVPLSARGREQAAAMAESFRGVSLDAVHVSPLRRARETASALIQPCPRLVAPELNEVSGGAWDGMRFSDIYEKYPDYFDPSGPGGGRTPPGGEGDAEALARALPLVKRLAEAGGSYALVTHAGVGRILVCELMGLPLHMKRAIPMDYASVTVLDWDGEKWTVRLSEDMAGFRR